MSKFVLVGNGLAGGLLAAYLGKRGHEVDLYERRSDPRAGNFVGGRSINLALSTRGIHALAQVGLAESVLAQAIPMQGRMIHSRRGDLHFAPYDRDPAKHINSIGRAALNTAVTDCALESPSVRVFFDHRCNEIDLEKPEAEFSLPGQSRKVVARGDAVIGVDGAFSIVRQSMRTRLPGFDYRESYLDHGYKELTIPPTATGEWRMEKNALHIWPRRSFMMIALPNPDGSFTCTLFWEKKNFDQTTEPSTIQRLFEREFPDALPLMPALVEEFRENPTGSLVTIYSSPWIYEDKVALLGDAAHAVVPFYGQGMNAAFEDCEVLDQSLARFPHDRGAAFRAYYAERKQNADALAELALENFVEMRDKAASPIFRAKKKLDHFLEGALPGKYLPLYTMVSFTRIPYAAARRRARRQNGLLFLSLGLIVATLIAVGWFALGRPGR